MLACLLVLLAGAPLAEGFCRDGYFMMFFPEGIHEQGLNFPNDTMWCRPCPQGQFGFSSHCKYCPQGKFSKRGQSRCEEIESICPQGTFMKPVNESMAATMDAPHACEKCPQGKYSTELIPGFATCAACRSGTWSDHGKTSCSHNASVIALRYTKPLNLVHDTDPDADFDNEGRFKGPRPVGRSMFFHPEETQQCCLYQCKGDNYLECKIGCDLWLKTSSLNWESAAWQPRLKRQCWHKCRHYQHWQRLVTYHDNWEGANAGLVPTDMIVQCQHGCSNFDGCMSKGRS